MDQCSCARTWRRRSRLDGVTLLLLMRLLSIKCPLRVPGTLAAVPDLLNQAAVSSLPMLVLAAGLCLTAEPLVSMVWVPLWRLHRAFLRQPGRCQSTRRDLRHG